MKTKTLMMYMKILVITIIIATIGFAAMNQDSSQLKPGPTVAKNMDCHMQQETVQVPVYSSVTRQREVWGICQVYSEENQTNQPKHCITGNESYIVEVLDGYDEQIVEKEVCTEQSLQINTGSENKNLEYKQFGSCSYKNITEGVSITCDSKHDGNSNGICESGESCCTYIVTSNGITSNCDVDTAFINELRPLEVSP